MSRRSHLNIVPKGRRSSRRGSGGGSSQPPSANLETGNPFGVFLLFVASGALSWWAFTMHGQWPDGVVWTLGGLSAFASFTFLAGLFSMCPGCKRSWAEEELGEERLDRWVSSYNETYTDSHYDRNGRKTGETKVSRPVTVTMEQVRTYFGCCHCDHRWDKVSERAI